jgi:hypothetical protein
MSLSPFSIPFFSCISSNNLCKRNELLAKAKAVLSRFDFNLLSAILNEWEDSLTLSSCFSKWQLSVPKGVTDSSSFSLLVLSFNVRGLDLRWQEILLIISSFKPDVLILLETGNFEMSFYEKTCFNFKLFFQKGENSNGGVLILVKKDYLVSRIDCCIPNVCIVDIKGCENVRIFGVYAPTSRSWNWQDLSPLLNKKCVIFGDFNVDLFKDAQKSEVLLEWADSQFLAPILPDSATSLRSDRTIDYAFTNCLNVKVQTYHGNTTSDHLPILSVVPFKRKQNVVGKNVHWKVFSLFTEYTFSFWEGLWNFDNIDRLYGDYSKFLFLLSSRCTIVFPGEKYRPAIPVEIRSFLSYIRALSFQQMRTKNCELKRQIVRLKTIARNELKSFFSSNLSTLLYFRNSSSSAANFFWYRVKRHLKPASSSVHALIDSLGQTYEEPETMCNVAADYYENFFCESTIYRPHPYTDCPIVEHENVDEQIPEVTIEELLHTVQAKRKKKSVDANGLSNYMFNFLDQKHWSLFLKLFNYSFQNAILPRGWKNTRMILIAKKDAICSPALTRPISLIDSFLKVGERLFLDRFRDVLARRGIIPDNQSGFRPGFRLQTRLLLFLEDIYSLLCNSEPICTIFIDFKSAFDNLWHKGCIGKLRNLGIPRSYLKWIDAWLSNRKCFVDFYGCRSRLFSIGKGGPQGSVLTPTVFISYHCDMSQFLSSCSSHLFADDFAAILAGQLGIRFTDQCLDLEKRVKSFLDLLEFYSHLTDQPINRLKTEALFSARAIGSPKFIVAFDSAGNDQISWVKEYKYLGYIISSKLGWSKLIKSVECKVRKRVALIRSFKVFGSSSACLRKTLFYSHVLPIFTWIYPVFPLFTRKQQENMSKFYYTSLRRSMNCLHWNELFFASLLDELSFEDRCSAYWNKYLVALSNSIDGNLIFEKANIWEIRKSWLDKEFSISCLRKSKRLVPQTSILEKVVSWLSSVPQNSSVFHYDLHDIELLQNFSDSFC